MKSCINGHDYTPFDTVRIYCKRCGHFQVLEELIVPIVSYKRGPYKKKIKEDKGKSQNQIMYEVVDPKDIDISEDLSEYLLESENETDAATVESIGELEAASVRAFRNAMNPKPRYDNESTELGDAGVW
jgi:hypothetical protein